MARIVHLPQAGDDSGRAGVDERPCQANQALALDLLAKSGLTGAQHHEIRVETHVVDVVQAEVAILSGAALIDERQNQGRQRGTVAVDDTMCGEMDDR